MSVATIPRDRLCQMILRMCVWVVMALYGSGARNKDRFWSAMNRMMYSHAERHGIFILGQAIMVVTPSASGKKVRTHVSRVGVISGKDWKRYWRGAADMDDW